MDHSNVNNECPSCGYISDACSVAKGAHRDPKEGDFSVCIGCGALSVFSRNLQLVAPTIDEMMELQKNCPNEWRTIEDAQAFIQAQTLAGKWSPTKRRRK